MGTALLDRIRETANAEDMPGKRRMFRRLRDESRVEQRGRSTFIVEVLLLFACLMIVIAVVMSVFAYASYQGAHAAHLNRAITIASDLAEKFAQDPFSIEAAYSEDGYIADCSLDVDMDGFGAMVKATITVEWSGQDVYSMKTARYLNNRELENIGRVPANETAVSSTQADLAEQTLGSNADSQRGDV